MLLWLSSVALGDPDVLFVDARAPGSNDGSSWENAYNDLQDAIDHALRPSDDDDGDENRSDDEVDEIWVAQGVYTPSARTEPDDPRTATFTLVNGVVIKGGFAGFGVADPNARDLVLFETILSGDLAGDDEQDMDRRDNSYHVVTGSQIGSLDGVSVVAGNANAWSYGTRQFGGGMFNIGVNPTVTNCTFRDNFARYGGGMSNTGSNPRLDGCSFTDNYALVGGGLDNFAGSSPMVTGCTFTRNIAGVSGGGMINEGSSSPMVADCLFLANSAQDGGALLNVWQSDGIIDNCTFVENVAGNALFGGGGVLNRGSSPVLTRCTFRENFTSHGGGGFATFRGAPTFSGCVFIRNDALYGGGLHVGSGAATVTASRFVNNFATISGGGIAVLPGVIDIRNSVFTGNSATNGGGLDANSVHTVLSHCTFTGNRAIGTRPFGSGGLRLAPGLHLSTRIENCVVWGNSNADGMSLKAQSNLFGARFIPTHSAIQGWNLDAFGSGTIGDDPRFVSPGHWDDPGTPNFPLDDVWIDGDYRLAPGSPCIDAGRNDAFPIGPNTDIDGNPRAVDDPDTPDCPQPEAQCGQAPIVDMGAYEFQPVVPLRARLDILPGRCPNRVNRRRRSRLRVAVVGTESFDVTEIDVASLRLARTDGVGQSIAPFTAPHGPRPRVSDVATPFDGDLCDCHELRRDGIDDLLLRFSNRAMRAAFDFRSLPPGASVSLTLRGSLLDGGMFEASDCVAIKARGSHPPKRVDRR